MADRFASDYVEVKDRVEAFHREYEHGSIQCEIVRYDPGDGGCAVVKASVYRTPDDPRPSVAHSQLSLPGRTSFTRGAELENAETSAVGRALAFLGYSTRQGLASGDEIRKAAGTPQGARGGAKAPPKDVDTATGEILPPPATEPLTAEAVGNRVGAWMKEKGFKWNEPATRVALGVPPDAFLSAGDVVAAIRSLLEQGTTFDTICAEITAEHQDPLGLPPEAMQ